MVRAIPSAFKRLCGLIMRVSIGLLVVLGCFVARVMLAPIDLPIPKQMIDDLMAQAAPGWRVDAAAAEFDLFSDDGLTGLKLRDVRLLDENGGEAASVPAVALRLALSANSDYRKAVSVREVRLGGARVEVTKTPEGAFKIGLGSVDGLIGDNSGESDFASLFDPEVLDLLPRLAVKGAQVRYHDESRDFVIETKGGNVLFDPSAEAVTVKLDAEFETGKNSGSFISIVAERAMASGNITANAMFHDLNPAHFAAMDATLSQLRAVDVPLSGTAVVSLDAQGAILSSTADISANDGGEIVIDDTPRILNRLAAQLAYDGDLVSGRVSALSFEDNGLALNVVGDFAERKDGQWAVDIESPGLAYDETASGQSLRTGEIKAAAVIDLSRHRAVLSEVALSGLQLRDKADGTALDSGPIRLTGSVDGSVGATRLTAFSGTGLKIRAPGDVQVAVIGSFAGSGSYASGVVEMTDMRLADLTLPHAAATVKIAKAGLSGVITPGRKEAAITDFSLSGLDATLQSTAERVSLAQLQGSADLRDERLALNNLRAGGIIAAMPDLYDAPLRIDQVEASLAVAKTANGAAINIASVQAVVEGVFAKARGQVRLAGDDLAGKLEAEVASVDFMRVPALWPKGVVPGGLSWIKDNVKQGQVDGVTIRTQFDTAAPQVDALDLLFEFHDAIVQPAPGLPPIRDGIGRGRATLDRFDLSVSTGHVAIQGTSGFSITDSSFSIIDFSPYIPEGHIKLNVDGPVQSVLRYLDHEPLALLKDSGFDLSSASGNAKGRVVVTLPLDSDLRVEDVAFKAKAQVREFALVEPHTNIPISGDTMQIDIWPDGLRFRSDARIDGLSARLDYEQAFAKPTPGEPESILKLESYLTREDFAKRGADVSDFFDGVAVLEAKIGLFPGGGARIAAETDLSGAELRIDRIGWVKPIQTPVTAAFQGFRNPDGVGSIEKITVRGDGVNADGALSFDATGGLQNLTFERLLLGDKLDAAVRYTRGAQLGMRIEVAGRLLDLRVPFAEAMDADAPSEVMAPAGKGPVTEVAARIQQVRLRDDLAIADLSGGIRLRGSRIDAAKAEGHINGVGPALLLAERRDNGLALRLTSTNAGAFLDGAAVFKGASGGNLVLEARTRDDVLPSQITGRISMNDITVRNSQTLREILSGGSIGSLVQSMIAGGLNFQKVDLPFSGIAGRWKIDGGVAYGSSLGLTLGGAYDIDSKGIALNGTISPAYAINGALGAVPVLGKLLTGGEGEGIFGVTYAVSGTTDTPNVWVNPLSALAPGFLRKIVSGVMDGQGGIDTPRTARIGVPSQSGR